MKQRAVSLLLPVGRSTDSFTKQSAQNAAGWSRINQTMEPLGDWGGKNWSVAGFADVFWLDFTSWLYIVFPSVFGKWNVMERSSAPPFLQHKVQCAPLSLCQLCVISPPSLCLTLPSCVTNPPCHLDYIQYCGAVLLTSRKYHFMVMIQWCSRYSHYSSELTITAYYSELSTIQQHNDCPYL